MQPRVVSEARLAGTALKPRLRVPASMPPPQPRAQGRVPDAELRGWALQAPTAPPPGGAPVLFRVASDKAEGSLAPDLHPTRPFTRPLLSPLPDPH